MAYRTLNSKWQKLNSNVGKQRKCNGACNSEVQRGGKPEPWINSINENMFPSLTFCQCCFLCWCHSPSDCVHSAFPALHRRQSFQFYKESKPCALMSRSIFDKGLWLDALGCTHTLVLPLGDKPLKRKVYSQEKKG